MDLRRMDVSRQSEDELRTTTKALLEDIVHADGELPPELDKNRIDQQVLDEVVGLDPLEDLLADELVTEIMVNRFDEIFIERGGRPVQVRDHLHQRPGRHRRHRRIVTSAAALTNPRPWWMHASRMVRG